MVGQPALGAGAVEVVRARQQTQRLSRLEVIQADGAPPIQPHEGPSSGSSSSSGGGGGTGGSRGGGRNRSRGQRGAKR